VKLDAMRPVLLCRCTDLVQEFGAVKNAAGVVPHTDLMAPEDTVPQSPDDEPHGVTVDSEDKAPAAVDRRLVTGQGNEA